MDDAVAAGLAAGVRAVAMLFGAAACSVAVASNHGDEDDEDLDADGGGGELRFVAAHGEGERQVVGVLVPPGQGIVSYVLASGSALAVADVGKDPRFDRALAESTGYVPRTILAAPLIGRSGVIGVTEVLDPTVRARDLDVLGLVGVLLAGIASAVPPPSGQLADAVADLTRNAPGSQGLAADLLRVLARSGHGMRR